MKKNILAFLFLTIFSTAVFAAFIPVMDIKTDSYFESPARLVDIKKSTPFGFMIDAGSDIQALQFLSNPNSGLIKSADYIKDFLLSKDGEYILTNFNEIQKLFSDDPNFPKLVVGNKEEAKSLLDDYLKNNFENLPAANKTWIAISALSSTLNIYPTEAEEILGGNLKLALNMYGMNIDRGFGWDWQVNLDYTGSSSMLGNFKAKEAPDYIYGNTITLDVRSNIGYATNLISDNFAIGISVQPQAFFQTTTSNYNFLLSRMEDDIISMFAINNFNLGLGVGLNIGTMYKVNDELAFTLDVRNAPSFKSQFYFNSDDIVGDKFKLHRDRNIYYIPTDIAITAIWNHGPFDLEVEMSDMINQLIWMNEVEGFEYNFYSIPKIRFGYEIFDDFKLTSKLQYEGLSIGIKWKDLSTEIATRFDKANISFKLGYEF